VTDEAGNRYERRRLSSGGRFEIIKNFYTRQELDTMFSAYGREVAYEELENFWVLSCRGK
jgi:hypothetical protein